MRKIRPASGAAITGPFQAGDAVLDTVITGSLDRVLPPAEHLPAIERALTAGGNRDVTIREIPGVNHLMQTAKTGTVAEYDTLDESFSPIVLESLYEWLAPRLRLPARRPPLSLNLEEPKRSFEGAVEHDGEDAAGVPVPVEHRIRREPALRQEAGGR